MNKTSNPAYADFNGAPPNMSFTNPADFWRWFDERFHRLEWASFYPQLVTSHSFYPMINNVRLSVFVDPIDGIGRGYAMGKSGFPMFYVGTAACEHILNHESAGRCMHRYTCTKCGYTYTVDSSD